MITWLLKFLGNIPTASNLALKLRDAEAKIAVLEAKVSALEKEKLDLQVRLEQANNENKILKDRLAEANLAKLAEIGRQLNRP